MMSVCSQAEPVVTGATSDVGAGFAAALAAALGAAFGADLGVGDEAAFVGSPLPVADDDAGFAAAAFAAAPFVAAAFVAAAFVAVAFEAAFVPVVPFVVTASAPSPFAAAFPPGFAGADFEGAFASDLDAGLAAALDALFPVAFGPAFAPVVATVVSSLFCAVFATEASMMVRLERSLVVLTTVSRGRVRSPVRITIGSGGHDHTTGRSRTAVCTHVRRPQGVSRVASLGRRLGARRLSIGSHYGDVTVEPGKLATVHGSTCARERRVVRDRSCRPGTG
jgi:hypothetical protein